MKIFKGCQKVAGRGLISWFIKSEKCLNTRKKDASGVLFGIRQLPIMYGGVSPAQRAGIYLGHHNPGRPQASARLGLKTIHRIVFCCAPASTRLQPRTLRVLPAQGPEREVSDCKRKRTPCGVLFLLGSGSYLSFRAVASQVLSAYKGLTSVFGMGTGGTP